MVLRQGVGHAGWGISGSMSKDCKRDNSVTCTSPAYYNETQRTERVPERITWLSCVLCNKGGMLVGW
jgi:hypothetical protein